MPCLCLERALERERHEKTSQVITLGLVESAFDVAGIVDGLLVFHARRVVVG